MGRYCIIFLGLAFALGAACEDPPLPPGLEGSSPAAPALPPGLESGASTPSPPTLPPGLEGSGASETTAAQATQEKKSWPFALHGFLDARAAIRTNHDETVSRDLLQGETRLQLETEHAWDRVGLDFTGDLLLDATLEEASVDLRRLRLTWTPLENLDLRVGRQVLTWGTGDLLFINDLFPKDYESFLIGRDEEYLKAPSDALRVGWYNQWMNVELVYTPQFAPDLFITGERLSYYQPLLRRRAGEDDQANWDAPHRWFRDDEVALRLYRSFGKFELALYAYDGYWKSPGGQSLLPPRVNFPRLSVYGASLRGPVGKGIGNIEAGYYDSRQDRNGDNFFINNSEFRVLVGYEREIGKEFTASVQYYLEHMMNYEDYRRAQPAFIARRDEDRHLVTLRLTKLLMNQNLTLGLFTFYSPSDGDAYVRPRVSYKINDQWLVEGGGNIFLGATDSTFFGQMEENSNLFAAVRFSF